MSLLTSESLLNQMRSLRGVLLKTSTGKPYEFVFREGAPHVLVGSTGELRAIASSEIDRAVEVFNRTGGTHWKDYKDAKVGVNTSYYFPILRDTLTKVGALSGFPERPPNKRKARLVLMIERKQGLAASVRRSHESSCQVCGETLRMANGDPYAEVHHVRPLGRPHNGPDSEDNMMCVCPNHHVLLDRAAISLDPEQVPNVAEEFVAYHNARVQEARRA